MAITVGNNSSQNKTTSGNLTWSHDSDENFLVVCVGIIGVGATATVTYDGVPMTEARTQVDSTTQHRSYIFYLENPSSGSNTVLVTTAATDSAGSATSLGSVYLGDSLESTASTNSTTSSLTLSGVSGSMLIDCDISESGTPTLGAGQTAIATLLPQPSVSMTSSYKAMTSSPTETMSRSAASANRAFTGASFNEGFLPTVATGDIQNLFQTTGDIVGSDVTDSGSTSITERGVVVSTTTAPTISDTKFTTAGTTGVYTTAMSSLSDDILYYCRAFATNSLGTSYGSEITFKTDEDAASRVTITTNPITFT